MVNMSRLVLWRAQVMSICETQYSGASVILISPDSDNLSVLQVPFALLPESSPARVYLCRPACP